MTSPDHTSTDQESQAADRIAAVTEFLLDRESLLPAVASRLGPDAVFESAIRGSSMAPAIPKLSRLRVQLLGSRVPELGDILFYLADDGFMVHRVVHQVSAASGERYYLTIGDNCLAPDRPVSERRVLGTVIAVDTTSGTRQPGSPRPISFLHRFARAISVRTTIVASHFGWSTAAQVAAVFSRLEDAGRARTGRVFRFIGLLGDRRRTESS
jgi:hypothetical protein